MKRLYLFIICIGFTIQLFSQQTNIENYSVEIKEISSSDFELTTFDNSNGKCKFRKNVLELECKKNESFACTTTELEYDVTNVDFILKFQFEPQELDDKHPLGIVYDYKNEKNFQALCFGKKNFQVLGYEGGEKAVVKEGLYKLKDKKNLIVSIMKKGKRLDFYIGSEHLPLTTLRNSKIQYSSIGFYVENKTKIKITGIGYQLILENEEDEETE